MTDTYTVIFDYVDEQGESQSVEVTVKAKDKDKAADLAREHPDAPDHGTSTVRT